MIVISKEKAIYRFSKENPPAYSCTLPAELIFETKDAFSGQIKTERDTLTQLDFSIQNPATGPVYFQGVQPGDVLEIKINKIKCESPGFAMCIPDEGVIGHLVKKSITKIYTFEDNMLQLTDQIKLPLHPMIGVIGVAPKEGEPLTMYSGDYGGNMDTRLIKEGASLYLPVFVEGGLLAMGDLHAAQGDGESFYTGLEVSGEIQISVKVRKDLKMDIPFVRCEGKLASIATEKDVDHALKKAMEKLVQFIVDNGTMDFYDAGFLCGLYGDLEISQVVDPVKTARMSISEEILGKLDIHL